MWIVLFFVLIILFVVLMLPGRNLFSTSFSGNGKISFYSKGFDAGFSLSEINLLWQVASRVKLSNPAGIYGSVEEINKAISHISGNKKFLTRDFNDAETLLLSKLFAFRSKMEIKKSRYKAELKSTHNIAVGQYVKIRMSNGGIFSSKIVSNQADYIAITVPLGTFSTPKVSWSDELLSIYFWREDDAGYFFQSKVDMGYYDQRNQYLRIFHSDSMLRSQKRTSTRVASRIISTLFFLDTLDENNLHQKSKDGIPCVIIDLSETGAAVKMRGKKPKKMAVKLHFRINEEMLVLKGLVKMLKYHEDENLSILHVEFLTPSDHIRMALLYYVFDINQSRTLSFQDDDQQELFPDWMYLDGEKDEEMPSLEDAEILEDPDNPDFDSLPS